ncbi:MAG: S8 family serine peptidase, partial [Deltaproteobacteria bacterium]
MPSIQLRVFSTLVICGLSFFLLAGKTSSHSKISDWLLKKYKTQSQRDELPTVLIFMKEEADFSKINQKAPRAERIKHVFHQLVKTSQKSQIDLLAWLESEKISARSFYINNMIVADKVSLEQLEQIAQREDVLNIVGNPPMPQTLPKVMRESDDEPKGPGANLVRLGAVKVWDEFKVKGENIVVAGQDTGVRWDHAALKSHYRGWDGKSADHSYSWHDSVHKNIGGSSSCGYDSTTPCDDHSHGTHTLGTVVGDDSQGNQIGVAPSAKWVACRNMDSGIGSPEMYVECFQWFLAPWPQNGDPIQDARPELAPHVINNSWGCPKSEGCEGNEFERILKALRAAGIFVVVSAGNDGSSCGSLNTGPAFHSDLVLSVGAMNHRTDTIASFSSRGPSSFDNKIGPHVTAPGVDVRSAVPSGGYAESGWSGTSMAGPHLVGLVALLWSSDPSLVGNIEATEELIRSTAEPKTSTQTCGGTE